jgi:3-hydroxypropionyl-CoA synthetase (ADP-forming)
MRVIGPNCIGILSSESGLETFFQPLEMMARPGPGPIAILSQSGTYGATLLEWFAEEGLGVSKFASYGNGADVDELDLLEYLMRDPSTGLIVYYIEGMGRAREFAKMASVAGQSRPVLMLKGGRSGAGAAAASSHTGSIAGSFGPFEGAMAQSGAVLAADSEELFDLAKLFALQPEPSGGRVAMVTNGAGPCVVAADIISGSRWLSLARLSDGGAAALRERLPPYNVVGNPVDLTGSADAGSYRTALEVMARDPNVDVLMPVFVFQDAPLGFSADGLVPVMEAVNKMGKTVLAVAGGGPFTRRQSMRLQGAGVPVFPTAGRALAALEGLVRHSRWKAVHRKVE